jgi:autotransporter-associated beta strand protein
MRRFFFTFACSVAAMLITVLAADLPTRADWSDSFPGGEPDQFWDFTFNAPPFANGTYQFASGTSGTMGNLTIRGDLGTTIGYGIVPTDSFAGRGVVVRSLVNPSGTVPGGPNVGVAGMVDTGPGTGYLATISTTTPGISTLSLVKATATLGSGSFVFSTATPYTVELETLGPVIMARAFNSSGRLLQSVTRLDSTPWLEGFAGVAAWKGSGTAPASPSGNWGTTSARAATPNGGLLWAPTGSIPSGTVATGTWTPTSLTWISSTNTSGPVAWDPATPAIFAANGTTGGTVYVSGSAVRVEAGMRFIVGGYRIASATSSPGMLVLGGPDPVFEVDDAPPGSLQVATIDVPLTGTAGFRKARGGLLALTGTVNTYAGQTRIDDGVLEVSALANSGSASSIGTGTTFPTIIVGGSATTGTLRYVGSGTAVTNRDVSIGAGGGRIESEGFGPMLFTAGTFNTLSPSVTTFSTLTIAGGNSGTNTIRGVIQNTSTSASLALVKDGTGTWILTGANTYSGGTIVSAGTLRGNDTSLRGAITNNAAIVFDQKTTGTYAGVMSGSGSLTKTGTGTLALSNTNYLTGSTTVQQGTLQLANEAALASSKIVPLAGGTVSLTPYLQTTVGGLAPNAGGLVDLGNGLVTVASGLTAADLVTAIVAGRAGGSWTGTSGITSSVAASDVAVSIPRAVGWLDNGNGSVTAAFAAPGDTNIDWQVDVLDASNFLSFGKFDTGLPATWLEGDFNYDGVVDVLDAANFFDTGLYNAGNYNTPAGTTAGIAAVPEPSLGATVVVAAVATSWFVCRRRARHIRGAKLFGGVTKA